MTAPRVEASDPRFQVALDEIAEQCGMRVEEVLLPDQWDVLEIDGKALVTVSVEGLRALSSVAPATDADMVDRTEELIAAIRKSWGAA